MAADTGNAKLLSPLKLYAAVVLICGVLGLQNVGLRLTSDPMFAKDGAPVTISCRDTGGNNMTTVQWYRNNVIIFQTSHLLPNQTLDENRNTSVYGRITVDATIRRHDIILPFNTTLDERSVWECRDGGKSSYKMTLCSVHIDECIRPNLTTEPKEALDGNNITLSCRHGAGRNITTVLWYRNYVYIFQTSTRIPEIIQDEQSGKQDYQAVDGRILVNAGFAVHNVSLQMNTSLDAESVWTCDNHQKFSNDLVIETKRAGSSESTAFPLSPAPTTYGNANSSESTTFPLSSTQTTDENVTDVQTTVSIGELTADNTRTPMPSQDSTLFIVTGVLLTAVILLIVTIFTVIVCRKTTQALRSRSATAETVSPEQGEAGLRINPVYVASHAMEGPLSSTALADSSAHLACDGNRHPDGRGDYDVPEMNVPQPSNIYEQLKVYEEI